MRSLICTFMVWTLRCSFSAYCLLHRTELHLHASSPNVCNWQKKKQTITNLQHIEKHDLVEPQCGRGGCRGALCPSEQGSASTLPHIPHLRGNSFLILFLFLFLSTLSPSFHLSVWQHADTHYTCAQSRGICEQTPGLSTVPKCVFCHLAIHSNLYHKYTTLLCSLFPLLFPRRSPDSWWGIEKATCNQVT